MKEHIIQLDPDDDVVSVRDKLAFAKASRVLLVFPRDPRSKVLQERLDLILIQRDVTRLQANVALITRDPIVRENARELGIPCFRSIKASQRDRWEVAHAELTVSRGERANPLTRELAEAGSRFQEEQTLSPRVRRVATIAMFVGSILTVIGVGVFIIPGATVRLAPASNQASETTTITASPDFSEVDAGKGTIPARLIGVEVEGTASISTTGTVQVPSTKARGAAVFTNLLPDQVTIPAGTVVRTSAGTPVRFATMADVTLPGQVNATVEVAIEAIDPGFEGNLPSARINVVDGILNGRVAVTNSTPTRGGDSSEVQAVSSEDLDRVRGQLLQQLQQRAYAEMQTDPFIALQDSEFIPIETLNVVLVHSEDYDGYAGKNAEELSLSMRVTVQGIAVDERFARQVIYAQLSERIGEGLQIIPETLVFRRGEVTQGDSQFVTFVMQGAGDVSTSIDPNEVIRLVRGRTIYDARLNLDRELALDAPAEIVAWPGFWPFTPLFGLRIQLEIIGPA